MPIFLSRWWQYTRSRLTGWRLPLAVAVFVLLSSWVAMALVEPASNELTRPENYWWYFVVTASTVGYGDHFPETAAGHVVGAYVIVGGIVALTLLFTQLAHSIQTIRGRRMRGIAALDLQGHVVLLGYQPGRTQRIVDELTAEGRLQVALCAWDDVGEHPVPERPDVQFVRGDLTHVDLMSRAGVDRARTAIIDGRDDNESLAIAVAVDHANPDIHMIAGLRDLSRRNHFGYVNARVHCVQWHNPFLLTEEAVDPGISDVYTELMTSGGDGNTYSLRLPSGFRHTTFGDCQTHFGRTFGATLIALRTRDRLAVSPPWDHPIDDDTQLYYVARERIDPSRLAVTG